MYCLYKYYDEHAWTYLKRFTLVAVVSIDYRWEKGHMKTGYQWLM